MLLPSVAHTLNLSAVQTFWCPTVWPGCRGNPRPAGAHVTAPTSQRWPSQCGRSKTAAPATRLEREGEERRCLEPWKGRVRLSAHRGGGNKTLPLKQLERRGQRLEPSGTFGARVPQSDVSVGAAWGQPSTQRWVGNTVEHFGARLWRGQKHSQFTDVEASSILVFFLARYWL